MFIYLLLLTEKLRRRQLSVIAYACEKGVRIARQALINKSRTHIPASATLDFSSSLCADFFSELICVSLYMYMHTHNIGMCKGKQKSMSRDQQKQSRNADPVEQACEKR
jgi:hypothetical protein